MGISFLILLSVVGGLQAANDYRNQTIKCSFEAINACFTPISALGANVTAIYADKPTEMNQTCRAKGDFQTCIQGVPETCNAQTLVARRKIPGIVNLVNNLCNNITEEYKNFLNSSGCYNRNQNIRLSCAKEHDSKGTDAKSLCCKSKEIRECVEKNMTVCSRNNIAFQNYLMQTYSIYTDSLCGPYFQFCNGAVSNVVSVACILLMAKIALLSY